MQQPRHVPHFDPKVPGCIKFKGAAGTWLLQGSFGQGPVRFDPQALLLASWGTPLKTAPSRSWCLRSCFYNRACWDTTNFTHLSDLRWLMFELTGFKSELINIFDSGYANLSLLLPLVATAMSGFFKSKCDDIKQIYTWWVKKLQRAGIDLRSYFASNRSLDHDSSGKVFRGWWPLLVNFWGSNS